MEEPKFRCKREELPVIAGFVTESLSADLAVFNEYSPEFTETFVEKIRTKRNYCLELESSNIKAQRLKIVTSQLVKTEKDLRPILNKVEGYLKLAGSSLDVAVDSFGVGAVRDAISRSNDEGILASLQTLQKNLNRNLTVLQAKGLKAEVIDSLLDAAAEIDGLNNEQNSLMNERNRSTSTNLKDYNELWELLTPVFETARSLFRGVDEVKMKEYTFTALLKRVNAEGTKSEPVVAEGTN